jgi:hypothetical protein
LANYPLTFHQGRDDWSSITEAAADSCGCYERLAKPESSSNSTGFAGCKALTEGR